MAWLIGGIALFALVHLTAVASPGLRKTIRLSIGPNAYRSAFAALSITGLGLAVIGWRATVPVAIYAPPGWGATLAFLLMFVAIVLFGAAHAKTNIKRFVRHPQLTSIVLWAFAHLVSNGDMRSLILFSSMAVWATVEMILINHRDGEWQKPERASPRSEMIAAAISVVIYLVLIALHPYFAGVSPLPV